MRIIAIAVLSLVSLMAGAENQPIIEGGSQSGSTTTNIPTGVRGHHPESPSEKTRALKPKSVKECVAEENGCNNRPDAPKTRALKQKKGKECASSNDYCG